MNKIFYRTFRKILLSVFCVIAVGCGSRFETYSSLYMTSNGVKDVNNIDRPNNGGGDHNGNDDSQPQPPPNPLDPNLKFCSPLSFSHVTWSKGMSLQERRSFAIALSITGRFEGRAGWANLTNNFDGQGMSAGLLNQTLGTGSLQPLLWKMLTTSSTEFTTSFSSTNYTSITSMLQKWNTSKNLTLTTHAHTEEEPEEWHPSEKTSLLIKANTGTNDSVQWAVNTLYQKEGQFKADWKQQLQTLLQKPDYVSFQISAAEKIHNKALGYVDRVGIHDLRTYLLMFDIVTQNGSIKESRFQEWEAAVKSENLTSTSAILKKLVEIRLQDSLPEWRQDVRSRKYALIDGAGTVHGAKLNLTQSYCYQLTDRIQ